MKKIVSILFATLLISGCASTTPKQSDTAQLTPLNWQQHFNSIRSLQKWDANAQIAIKIDQKTQKAKMIWQQNHNSYDISFLGPFGQAGPKLSGDSQSVTLTIPREAPLTGTNTSALLQQRLGWQLPVENAKYWIKGIPSPLSDSQLSLKDERLYILQQDGWTITYDRYRQVSNQYLPAKILISRENLRFLLVIYKWEIHQPLLES
ncbi:MAG: lipoprotein insertase outer membrane protein LolB [Pseudomonadales bacterium]|nr:lipoprotein insertase outer membrane protein LolB [Pseudomonadales bacterium]